MQNWYVIYKNMLGNTVPRYVTAASLREQNHLDTGVVSKF